MSEFKSSKRVLVVAYVFPPVGGAGVQRVTKFVKYLPDFGWEATVLTAQNPSVPVYDASLLAEVPPQTVVVKARTFEPGYALKRLVSGSRPTNERQPMSVETGATSHGTGLAAHGIRWTASLKGFAKRALRGAANLLLQPDPQILWHHQALDAGLRALSERKHDAIFVTAPPFSSLLIGSELSRRTGLPLVLDYRDEWGISNAYSENKQQGLCSRFLQQRQQRRAVRSASALVATTQHSADALARVAREAGSQALATCIYNGYDSADFHDSQSEPFVSSASIRSDKYKLAYVGTLWNLTSVEPLVRAAQRLCQESPDLGARLELHFAGRRTEAQDKLLQELDHQPCRVVRHSYLDHDAALKLMQTSDGLCLLLSDVPDAGRVVPAKTFEYLAVRRPIFAIVPPGEVSRLLQECPFASIHSPQDVTGLAQRLGDEIERHRLGIALPTGFWDSSAFERRRQAGQLAALFDQVSFQSVPRTESAAAERRALRVENRTKVVFASHV